MDDSQLIHAFLQAPTRRPAPPAPPRLHADMQGRSTCAEEDASRRFSLRGWANARTSRAETVDASTADIIFVPYVERMAVRTHTNAPCAPPHMPRRKAAAWPRARLRWLRCFGCRSAERLRRASV